MTHAGDGFQIPDEDGFIEVRSKSKKGTKKKGLGRRCAAAIPEIVLEFQDEELRENALRCLSSFLIDVRKLSATACFVFLQSLPDNSTYCSLRPCFNEHFLRAIVHVPCPGFLQQGENC